MAIAFCPHCGRRLPEVYDAFCGFCREPLDEPIEPSEQDEGEYRSSKLGHIPRAPDVVSGSGRGIPKWGAVIGVVFGIASAVSRGDRGQMNDSAYFVGTLIGGGFVRLPHRAFRREGYLRRFDPTEAEG
jgi:hypothetical protein